MKKVYRAKYLVGANDKYYSHFLRYLLHSLMYEGYVNSCYFLQNINRCIILISRRVSQNVTQPHHEIGISFSEDHLLFSSYVSFKFIQV